MKPTTLAAAREAAAAARERHETDAAALARGHEQVAATEAELTRVQATDAAAVARHAKRLEAHVRSGESGALPALVPTEKDVAAQISAQRTHAAALEMLASLEEAEQQSRRVHANAEAALQDAVAAAIGAEAVALAAELEIARTRVEVLEARLNAARQVPGIAPYLVTTVHIALHDDINTPVNLLRDRRLEVDRPLSEIGTPTTSDEDAAAHWSQRLEQLRTGEGLESPASIASAAA
jgi:hypothetical protein